MLLLLSRFSRVRLCATPETAAHQAPLSLGFSRQEHWSGLPFALLEWLLNVFGIQCNCQIEACKSLLHSLPSHPSSTHPAHTSVLLLLYSSVPTIMHMFFSLHTTSHSSLQSHFAHIKGPAHSLLNHWLPTPATGLVNAKTPPALSLSPLTLSLSQTNCTYSIFS